MYRLTLMLLGFAVCSASAARTAWQTELPAGRLVGGVIEDNGNAVVLLRNEMYPGQRIVKESVFVRLAPDGSIIDTIDLPGRMASGLRRLAGDRLLLSSSDQPDHDGISAMHRELIELGPSGGLRRLWGWDTRNRPDWEYGYFVPSYDGRSWALHHQGEQRGSPGNVVDRLYIKWGDLGPDVPEIDAGVELRFGDSEDDGLWLHVEELGYPGPVFLDSDGPVFAVFWKDRTYVLHMADDGSVKQKVRVFADASERLHRWQWYERVLWSRTDDELRAYYLPELGLSSDTARPFWVVERKGEFGEVVVHPERGVIGLRGEVRIFANDYKGIGDSGRSGGFSVDYVLRDPLESRAEERRTTGWHSHGGGLPFWITVSPNAKFVLAVQQYTNWTHIIPMGPAPPIPEP